MAFDDVLQLVFFEIDVFGDDELLLAALLAHEEDNDSNYLANFCAI